MFETKIKIDGYRDQYCASCNLRGNFFEGSHLKCLIYGLLEPNENGPYLRHKDCLLAQKWDIESFVLTKLYHNRGLAIRDVNEMEYKISECSKFYPDNKELISQFKEKLEALKKTEEDICQRVKDVEKELEKLKCILQK